VTAREELWAFSDSASTTSQKLVSAGNLARTMELVKRNRELSISSDGKRWMYATGLGWLGWKARASLCRALQALRSELARPGGSLVLLHRPEKMPAFDVIGRG